MESGSDFWRFSLSIYRMDGVPPACLALQDGHGLDVNLMLFSLWLASNGRAVSAGELREADDAVSEWRENAVVALRGVRRYLRSPPAAFDASFAAALRDRIKSVELESERLQQEALFALRAPDAWGRAETPHAAGPINMDACAESMGAAFENAPRQTILDAYRLLILRGAS
ncbi:MAG: TIGR02444 family protein [Beijerinckiaceae bacterium]